MSIFLSKSYSPILPSFCPGLYVDKLRQLQHEDVADVRLIYVSVQVLTFDETQEELVHDIDVGTRRT